MYSKILLTTLVLSLNSLNASDYQPKDGIISLYGAGGPHTALIKVAKLFTKNTGTKVNVHFGPERKWTEDAKKNADIIWGTSEQSMTAFLENYTSFDSKDVEPIYLRRAVIAVQKGNPKKITSFDDLLKPNIKVVVVEGAGVYNTSGTGVWEDVAGRKGSIEDVKALRKNIVNFAKGSGAGFKAFKNGADAWITWTHWVKTHPKDADMVELSKERVIYRDLSIVSNDKADKETKNFMTFLISTDAQKIFKAEGWSR